MTEFNEIPVMDDPLGRHWSQPVSIRFAPMDETHVLLSGTQLEGLSTYSATMPTGVYPGKCWRRVEVDPDRDLLIWYGAETPEKTCPILFREILSLENI